MSIVDVGWGSRAWRGSLSCIERGKEVGRRGKEVGRRGVAGGDGGRKRVKEI